MKGGMIPSFHLEKKKNYAGSDGHTSISAYSKIVQLGSLIKFKKRGLQAHGQEQDPHLDSEQKARQHTFKNAYGNMNTKTSSTQQVFFSLRDKVPLQQMSNQTGDWKMKYPHLKSAS
ncbi:hypothetical protein DUNSADRAFT_4340 [Dunaliella salina]|uniref:Encoded protein n=1 Tax=Dunaliella salina TaxID=3046 RepID=A0ABQ7H7P9_DUNSA|nr:hypothetical protein DUNSADRAFT_4340 [Dunaliella salina]|eukprot:KAF5842881.1 hypothetical protein DUNSADRAFT_4340 [Dunaliella salina]